VHRGSSFSVVSSSARSADAEQTVYRETRRKTMPKHSSWDLPFQGASNSGPVSISEPSVPKDDVPNLSPTPR
jgi:hypothetical protein